jgi:hypothetical protein
VFSLVWTSTAPTLVYSGGLGGGAHECTMPVLGCAVQALSFTFTLPGTRE